VTFKPANIQEPTPAKRSSCAGNFASDLAALGLHSSQHRFNGGRDRDREGFTGTAFRAGEREHTVFDIHALQRNLRLTQAATRSQSDLKADRHPFRDPFDQKSLPGYLDFIICKHGLYLTDRALFYSII